MAALKPATFPEFLAAVTPCLQLVAPVGMTGDDTDAWFDAAYMALSHLPADILADGARKAMGRADHPSKVVPAIIAASADWLESRRRWADMAGDVPALPHPRDVKRSADERAQIGKTMSDLVERMRATSPTVDDLLGGGRK
jgi:hypothetical protein